jgi:hypothetical protein
LSSSRISMVNTTHRATSRILYVRRDVGHTVDTYDVVCSLRVSHSTISDTKVATCTARQWDPTQQRLGSMPHLTP